LSKKELSNVAPASKHVITMISDSVCLFKWGIIQIYKLILFTQEVVDTTKVIKCEKLN
jgi:hypothetical protein